MFNTILGLTCIGIAIIIFIGAGQPAGVSNYFTQYIVNITKLTRQGTLQTILYWSIGPIVLIFFSLWGGLALIISFFVAWRKSKSLATTPASTM